MTPTTYRFTTFQQMLDRVPSDKILECLTEIGTALQAAKSLIELTWMVAAELAKKDGKELPPMPDSFFQLPEVEWVDDDNHETAVDIPGMFKIKIHRKDAAR